MRIIQFTPSLTPTGPVSVALDLGSTLRQLGHEVSFWFLDEKENAVDEKGERVSVRSLPIQNDIDIIHSHGLRPDMALSRLFKRFRSFRTVTTVHNLVDEDLKHQYSPLVSRVYSPLWVRSMRRHDARVTLTPSMAEYYRTKWRMDSKVIPNTRIVQPGEPDQEIVQELREFRGDGILLGSISYLTSRKGLDQAIRLLQRDPNYRLVIFGTGGESQNLKTLASEIGVTDRVWFAGHRSDAREYLPFMDVLVMPSHSEGFPLSMLEAIQSGTPVVGSSIPAFTEAFNDDEVPTFPIGDIEKFHETIQRTLKDREGFIARSREHFERSYSPMVIGKAYLELYQSLLS